MEPNILLKLGDAEDMCPTTPLPAIIPSMMPVVTPANPMAPAAATQIAGPSPSAPADSFAGDGAGTTAGDARRFEEVTRPRLVRVGGEWFDADTGEPEGRESRVRRPKSRQNRGDGLKGTRFQYREKGTVARDLILGGSVVRVWSPDLEKDEDVMRSIANLARYPDVHPFIAIMPDYHIGENSVNGSVIPTRNALFVNAIGGDIGCGMASAKFPLVLDELSQYLSAIYEETYARVPTGRRTHSEPSERIAGLSIFETGIEIMNRANTKSAMQQMGTLGSGNHFIEIQADTDGQVYVMVHTGSRILGQHIKKFGEQKGRTLARPRGVVALDANSPDGRAYMDHVEYAVNYARANRLEILRQVFEAFRAHVPKLKDVEFETLLEGLIDLPHNYIAKEIHFEEELYVHRKGAIYVPKGALGVIPGSMGSASFIVDGRGNPFALHSSSHGAGRVMPRGEALRTVRMEDFLKSMEGVLSRRDEGILDEAPEVYRNVDTVMRYQRDLVAIVKKLRPIAVVKG